MKAEPIRHAVVFGATGFLGRHLILALTAFGVTVTAACRSAGSFRRLSGWLSEHDCAALPSQLLVDFDAPGLGLDPRDSLATVSEIYNCAGAYRFGMSEQEARTGNVDSVRAIVGLAADMPGLRRLVQVSGYRVGGQDASQVPWRPERIRRTYRELGAYEASKMESDAVFQAEADRLGVPWSIVNPATVSGVSATGESDQYLGLAGSFKDLWNGKLAALPGNRDTFVPVVPVDFLAEFTSRLPIDPSTSGKSYWLLDDATPALPDLLATVGDHYRVRVPRLRIPVALIERLPAALTKADPETLSFMSTDRYPTGPATEFAERHGLRMPETVPAITRWADHLAAHRFGAATPTSLPRRFAEYAGVRTFQVGPERATSIVLPGIPVNADTWTGVAEALGQTLVVDLPGLGMSSGDRGGWPAWSQQLLSGTGSRHLVGHSIGAAAAVLAAAHKPGQVEQLTLVAPFFLQGSAGLATRAGMLTAMYFRRTSPEALSERLTGGRANAADLRTSVADLRRAGAAGRAARLLSAATSPRWRAELTRRLSEFNGSVHVIVGSEDPLAPWASEAIAVLGSRVRISTIDGAGHHPQLTHPAQLAAAITSSIGIDSSAVR